MNRVIVRNQQVSFAYTRETVLNNEKYYHLRNVSVETRPTPVKKSRNIKRDVCTEEEFDEFGYVTISVGVLANDGYAQASAASNVLIKLQDNADYVGHDGYQSSIFNGKPQLQVSLSNINYDQRYGGYGVNGAATTATSLQVTLTDADITTDDRLGTRCYEKLINDAKNMNIIQPYWPAQGYTITATLNITASYPKPKEKNLDEDPAIDDRLCITKKILQDEIACDVSITLQNGVAIKCHKSFLSAHSTVFQTMFQTSMKEAKTSTVEIHDMAEVSVRAFLAYLYYWETKEAAQNSLICFELFHAGHKYDIGKLEECMKKILLAKSNGWYDVDVGMRLFLFARNVGDAHELKKKAIHVLKAKFAELEKSKSYQQLFKKDPKAAMELCKYAFSA